MSSVVERLAFKSLSHEAAQVAGEIHAKRIYLPTIDVSLSLGIVHEPTKTNVLGIEILAEHKGLPKPIAFTAVGFGDDLEAASHSAAKQWFEVVFPVLHSLYAEHPTTEVTTAKISALNRETGKRFRWQVLLGPVRVVTGDQAESLSAPGGEIMETLKHEITGIAASSLPFWLNAFVAVHADGKSVADCRLMNEPWPEATERLSEAADDLLGATGYFHSWRQFFFFSPVPFTDSDSTKDQPSWWKKLTRRTT
jgi:uncharacterized protein DUF6348